VEVVALQTVKRQEQAVQAVVVMAALMVHLMAHQEQPILAVVLEEIELQQEQHQTAARALSSSRFLAPTPQLSRAA
jgi:hypothetical protein